MKNKTASKATAMLLATMMLFACSEKNIEDEKTDSREASASEEITAVEEEAEVEITRANYPDSLPEELDFGMADYRITCQESTDLSSMSTTNEMVTDELTGEIVNDAVYNRALSVMNRFNVNISKVLVSDTANAMKTTVKAGDNTCEIAACYAYYITPLALNGSFFNWLDFNYLDLSQPWWPNSLSDDIIIDNSLYFISGDISLKLLQYTYCMFFNKTIAEDWNIPNLYDLVLEGKWTLDKYIEVTSGVSMDLNGDGKYTDADLYGTMNNHYCDVRYACYNTPLSGKDADGFLTLNVMSEKFIDIYTKLYDYYHTSNSVTVHVDKMPSINMFIRDQLMIFPYLIVGAENMREMASDYGIIPYPKYDENQENYATSAHDNYSLMCVPVTVPLDKLDMIGAVTEAMAAESYRTVTPAYLEVTLKNKLMRDATSKAMIDIITSNIKFDPMHIYSNSISDVAHIWREVWNGTQDIASWYAKKEKAYNKSLEKFNQQYEKLREQ